MDQGNPMRITQEKFQTLSKTIWRSLLRSLPQDMKIEAQKLVIIIRDNAPHNEDLLGLYEGVPLNERHIGEIIESHDRITLYRIPITEDCRNESELKQEIRLTLIHELGHHLGFTEEELYERGLE
jgi:predicted Zn-dependent protease with MMP-like domain